MGQRKKVSSTLACTSCYIAFIYFYQKILLLHINVSKEVIVLVHNSLRGGLILALLFFYFIHTSFPLFLIFISLIILKNFKVQTYFYLCFLYYSIFLIHISYDLIFLFII